MNTNSSLVIQNKNSQFKLRQQPTSKWMLPLLIWLNKNKTIRLMEWSTLGLSACFLWENMSVVITWMLLCGCELDVGSVLHMFATKTMILQLDHLVTAQLELVNHPFCQTGYLAKLFWHICNFDCGNYCIPIRRKLAK